MKTKMILSAVILSVGHTASGAEKKTFGKIGHEASYHQIEMAAGGSSDNPCVALVGRAIPSRYSNAVKAAVAECSKPAWSWSN